MTTEDIAHLQSSQQMQVSWDYGCPMLITMLWLPLERGHSDQGRGDLWCLKSLSFNPIESDDHGRVT